MVFRLSAKAINPSLSNDFFRPIDVKVKPVLERWRAIKTHVTLAMETILPPERLQEKILEAMRVSFCVHFRSITTVLTHLVFSRLQLIHF